MGRMEIGNRPRKEGPSDSEECDAAQPRVDRLELAVCYTYLYMYGKQIFRPKSTVQPEFDKDTATKFFAEAYADKQREHEYEYFEDLPPPPTLSFTVKRVHHLLRALRLFFGPAETRPHLDLMAFQM